VIDRQRQKVVGVEVIDREPFFVHARVLGGNPGHARNYILPKQNVG
jgi:hypothetical protein